MIKRKVEDPMFHSEDFPLQMEPAYAVRFIRSEHSAELVNLYHLARTALAGEKCGRYERMLWASGAFSKEHPAVTATGAYKDLNGLLQ